VQKTSDVFRGRMFIPLPEIDTDQRNLIFAS